MEVTAERLWLTSIPEPNTGCWLWLGALSASGYGTISMNGKSHSAHRLSYRLHNTVDIEGSLVLHKCDQPSCINPDHLFLGTNADNAADKVRKGRQAKGASVIGPNHKSKKRS